MRKNYFENPITKRFIDAFPAFENTNGVTDENGEPILYFWETWQNSPFFLEELTKADLNKVYNHLLAQYYDWHFIYGDDLGIKLNVMHIVEEYYPNVKVRLDLVNQLRNMSLDEFKQSGIQISSSGANPKVQTQMDELIDLVDSQNASFQLKAPEQVIRAKFMALYDGIMDDFISRFKNLFVKLYNGVNDYIYKNKVGEA